MRIGLRALLLSGMAVLLAGAAPAAPPVARQDGAAEVYFGKRITDPYRWMEAGGAELTDWAQAQDTYARPVLAAIPGRARLLADLTAAARGQAVVTAVTRLGGRLFFLRQDAGAAQPRLFVRDSASGAERLLLDPNRADASGQRFSVGGFQPSQDGRYLAVILPQAGSAQDGLRVVDVETGALLPDRLTGAHFSALSWLPDGISFFYTRAGTDGAAVLMHRLGGDPAHDAVVFGAGHDTGLGLGAQDNVSVIAIPGTRSVLGLSRDAGAPEISIFLGTLPAGKAQDFGWKRIIGAADGVVDAAAAHGTLYLRSHDSAPQYKILALPLEQPDLARAKVILPARDGVLTAFAAAADGVYAVSRQGMEASLLRVGEDGKIAVVKLPHAGPVSDELSADPRLPGAVVAVQSWVSAPLWFSTGAGEDAAPAALQLAPGAAAVDDILVTETTVGANDGKTRLPLSIIEKKGTPHDKQRPVLVYAYGAFGVAVTPSAELARVIRAWVNEGGVFAVAHVRGGGEGGEAWHLAGARANKGLAAHDLVDCAWSMGQRLEYGNPATTAVMGEGAGGVAAGGAITAFPTQFRAALLVDGLSDPLRAQLTGDAQARAAEFGSTASLADFTALLGADAYQHVRAGIPYPAVLLSAGDPAWHEPLWQSAKMTARLQAAGNNKGPVLLRLQDGLAGRDAVLADSLAFLMWQLGAAGFQPGR